MPKELPFTKMQGTGNDYIYINGFEHRVENAAQLARQMSDRHFGVGGDGIVLILPSAIADLRMRMFNADGSEAEMCGNATRCVGKYAYDSGLARKNVIRLETRAGIKIIHLKIDAGEVTGAMVDMGEPELEPAAIPVIVDETCKESVVSLPVRVDGETFAVTAVSMGNPHAVLFVEDVDNLNLPEIGPKFENHPIFPARVNTEFVRVISSRHIRMRVWERGAGETMACGTGACAALVACVLNGFTEREADVELKGGTLHIKWDEVDGHIYMSGPAVTVFEGKYFTRNKN